jgi:hypothetical protein
VKDNPIKSAARAHSNLSMFYAVIALLEGGGIYGHVPAAQRIIKICKAEAGRQLAAYDRAVARIEGPVR